MSGEGDKRSVSTDALETLGTIHTREEKRDAIHLAVEPVTAGVSLRPGEDVKLEGGQAVRAASPLDGLGIVDPFLREDVNQGERFWLVVYPRQIRSLRHAWTHPAFPDEAGTEATKPPSREGSEAWLRDFCAKSDCPGYEVAPGATVSWDGRPNRFEQIERLGGYPAARAAYVARGAV
jgi:hypothetical protein